MAAGSSDQFAEGSWPGIRTDTDILVPPMSLDRTGRRSRSRHCGKSYTEESRNYGAIVFLQFRFFDTAQRNQIVEMF
jgi:hypothetical protein